MLNAIPLFLADHRADCRLRIAWISGPDLSDRRLRKFLHFAEPAPRHEDACAGDASLSAVHEARTEGQWNCLRQIGIVQNDGGGLAAGVERVPFYRLRAGAQDRFADYGRASEGDLRDIRLAGDLG